MIELTYEDAVQYAREAIELKGEDYVYQTTTGATPGPACRYARNGEPDCIVGHVFAKAGIPVELMEWNDSDLVEDEDQAPYSQSTVGNVIRLMAQNEVLWADEATVEFLSELQFEQDSGSTWGTAFRRARIS